MRETPHSSLQEKLWELKVLGSVRVVLFRGHGMAGVQVWSFFADEAAGDRDSWMLGSGGHALLLLLQGATGSLGLGGISSPLLCSNIPPVACSLSRS